LPINSFSLFFFQNHLATKTIEWDVGFQEVQQTLFPGAVVEPASCNKMAKEIAKEYREQLAGRQWGEKCCGSVCLGQNFLPLRCIRDDDGTVRKVGIQIE